MKSFAALLDEARIEPVDGWAGWHDRVAQHLNGSSGKLFEKLGLDSAWVALGWVEASASQVVQTMDAALLRKSIALLALLDEAAVLDGRDVRVVAGLLRRASELIGRDIADEVQAARNLPFASDGDCPLFAWLTRPGLHANTLHDEVGEGATFAFVRKRDSVDVDRLMARFGRSARAAEDTPSDD